MKWILVEAHDTFVYFSLSPSRRAAPLLPVDILMTLSDAIASVGGCCFFFRPRVGKRQAERGGGDAARTLAPHRAAAQGADGLGAAAEDGSRRGNKRRATVSLPFSLFKALRARGKYRVKGARVDPGA